MHVVIAHRKGVASRLAVCTCIGARSTGQAVKCIIGVLMAHLTACLSALGQGGAVGHAEHVAHVIIGVCVVHDGAAGSIDPQVLRYLGNMSLYRHRGHCKNKFIPFYDDSLDK